MSMKVEKGWVFEKTKLGFVDGEVRLGDRGIITKAFKPKGEDGLCAPAIVMDLMVPTAGHLPLYNGDYLQDALDEGLLERVDCTEAEYEAYGEERRAQFYALMDKHTLFDGTFDLRIREDRDRYDERTLDIIKALPGLTVAQVTNWFGHHPHGDYSLACKAVRSSFDRHLKAGTVLPFEAHGRLIAC